MTELANDREDLRRKILRAMKTKGLGIADANDRAQVYLLGIWSFLWRKFVSAGNNKIVAETTV